MEKIKFVAHVVIVLGLKLWGVCAPARCNVQFPGTPFSREVCHVGSCVLTPACNTQDEQRQTASKQLHQNNP